MDMFLSRWILGSWRMFCGSGFGRCVCDGSAAKEACGLLLRRNRIYVFGLEVAEDVLCILVIFICAL